jgi:glycosyltransferase involved in cell wall biosynthesis
MHRSGTSAVTRSLKVLSLDLGDKLIGPVRGDNEKGFWEDAEINSFNESLLSKLGTAWHRLAFFNVDLLLRPEYAFERKAAAGLLERKLSGEAVFAFKDPRTAILLPFWQAVFADLELEVGYLIVIRNPLEVAESLHKRNGFSQIKGLMLWAKHVIGAMRGTQGQPRIVVSYDSILNSTAEQLTRIAKALQLPSPEKNPDALREYMQDFLTASLRRNVILVDQLSDHWQVPPLVHDMYENLQRLSKDEISEAAKNMDRVWKRFYERYQEMIPLLPQIDFSDQANSSLQELRVSSSKEISMLQSKLQDVEQRLENQKQRDKSFNEFLKQENDQLRRMQEASRQEMVSLSDKFHVVQQEHQKVQAANESLKRQIEQIQARSEDARQEIAVLHDRLGKSRAEYEAVCQELDDKKQRFQNLGDLLEQANNELHKQRENSQKETGSLRAALDAAQKQHESERQTTNALRQQLEQRNLDLRNVSSLLEEQTKIDRKLKNELAAARQTLLRLEGRIHRITASWSWRLTYPLRAIAAAQRNIRNAVYRKTCRMLRLLWSSLPMSKKWKGAFKNFVFGRFGFLFRNKTSYVNWSKTAKTPSVVPAPSSRLTLQSVPSEKIALLSSNVSPASQKPVDSIGGGQKSVISLPPQYAEVSERSTVLSASKKAQDYIDIESIEIEEKCYFDLSAEPLGSTTVKTIAFYLPQFHCIPENDRWWGEGFTEWTNTRKARPLFTGHHQPRNPASLGYYDLSDAESYARQVMLAKKAGIYGFCFYFYWFGGKTLLEKPLQNILANPHIDQPFCLCWANENWTRRWDGQENEVLIAQKHSEDDSIAFLEYINKYFRDDRYVKVDGKPLLVVYRPAIIPDILRIQELWRRRAKELGWPGIYLVSAQTFGQKDPREFHFDAAAQFPPHHQKHGFDLNNETPGLNPDFKGMILDYRNLPLTFSDNPNLGYKLFRGVTLSWDNTARRGVNARIMRNFSLSGYANWLLKACKATLADARLEDKEKLVFINAWNEWAEGTYLEPDDKYGFGYLEATKRVLNVCASKRPRLSVVVPNYNHSAFIERRLNSIIHQTCLPDEIIFLDDASSDDSLELARGILAKSNIRFRIIKNENNSGNVFRQWLKGVEAATGDLIWIAESDDEAAPDFLAQILPVFDREDVLIAYGDISYVKGDGTPDHGLRHYYDGLPGLDWKASHVTTANRSFTGAFAIKNIIPNVSGAVFRRPTLTQQEKDRLIAYTFAGDWYFYALIARGGSIAFCKEAKSYFRLHQQSTSRKMFLTDRHINEHNMILWDLHELYGIGLGLAEKHAEALGQVLKDKAPKSLRNDLVKDIKGRNLKGKNLKICIASYSFAVGGGEVVPIDIANAMRSNGHHITFLVLRKSLPNDPPLLRPRLRNDIPVIYWEDIQDRFKSFMDEYGIEIFNSHNVGMEYALHRKNIGIDIPYIASLHGGYETVPQLLTKEFIRYLGSNVDEWLYLSSKNIEPLKGVGNTRFTKSFNAVASRPANSGYEFGIRKGLNIPEDAVLLVIASRALHDKGWQCAIDATGKLRELTGRDCTLLLIGDGPDFGAIKAVNLECKHVLFLGRVDNPLPIIRECDLGIFPSRYSGESFPLFVLECLQSGLPVIASDAGDIPQIMNADKGEMPGFVVPASLSHETMVNEMAKAGAKIILGKGELARFRERALNVARNFSIDKVTDLYLNVMYRQLGYKHDIS